MESLSDPQKAAAFDERAMLQHVGRVIAARRAALGWTLAQLAQRTGFTISPLSSLERGEAWMRLPSVLRIAQVLGLEMEFLFPRPMPSALHEIWELLLVTPPARLEALRVLLRSPPPPQAPPQAPPAAKHVQPCLVYGHATRAVHPLPT